VDLWRSSSGMSAETDGLRGSWSSTIAESEESSLFGPIEVATKGSATMGFNCKGTKKKEYH
jgi:hypothetical protein